MPEIRMPKFGMSAVDAEITDILVSPGDAVAVGQTVVEAGSDKVDFTVESEVAGTVSEVLVAVGDDCPMGAVMIVLT